MPAPTERDIRRDLDDLRDGDGEGADAVTVAWRDAAPAKRPEGMAWDPDGDGDDDDATTLTYDLWTAQRDCLGALDGEHDIVASWRDMIRFSCRTS